MHTPQPQIDSVLRFFTDEMTAGWPDTRILTAGARAALPSHQTETSACRLSPVPLCAISRQVVTRPRALTMIPIRHDGCTLITSRPPIPPVHLPQRAQGMARVVLFKHYRSGQPPAQIRVSTPCQLARRRRRRTVIGVHPDATILRGACKLFLATRVSTLRNVMDRNLRGPR